MSSYSETTNVQFICYICGSHSTCSTIWQFVLIVFVSNWVVTTHLQQLCHLFVSSDSHTNICFTRFPFMSAKCLCDIKAKIERPSCNLQFLCHTCVSILLELLILYLVTTSLPLIYHSLIISSLTTHVCPFNQRSHFNHLFSSHLWSIVQMLWLIYVKLLYCISMYYQITTNLVISNHAPLSYHSFTTDVSFSWVQLLTDYSTLNHLPVVCVKLLI